MWHDWYIAAVAAEVVGEFTYADDACYTCNACMWLLPPVCSECMSIFGKSSHVVYYWGESRMVGGESSHIGVGSDLPLWP